MLEHSQESGLKTTRQSSFLNYFLLITPLVNLAGIAMMIAVNDHKYS